MLITTIYPQKHHKTSIIPPRPILKNFIFQKTTTRKWPLRSLTKSTFSHKKIQNTLSHPSLPIHPTPPTPYTPDKPSHAPNTPPQPTQSRKNTSTLPFQAAPGLPELSFCDFEAFPVLFDPLNY